MFSRFAARVQGMAFAPYKNRIARASAASYAAETLAAYLQGQERAYAVHDAINELSALFHEGAKIPVDLIRYGLACEDEEKRAAFFEKAMDLIGQQVRADVGQC